MNTQTTALALDIEEEMKNVTDMAISEACENSKRINSRKENVAYASIC